MGGWAGPQERLGALFPLPWGIQGSCAMIPDMQQGGSSMGIVRRVVRRLRRSVDTAADVASVNDRDSETTKDRNLDQLKSIRSSIARLRQDIAAADREYDDLKAERQRLQRLLGEQRGRTVLPRLRVEKTSGVASFVVGARMMQRIHAKAKDPVSGIDGAGALFADAEETGRFARSHGVQNTVDLSTEATVVMHAFKGNVALIEIRNGGRVKHLTPEGEDPGDIRPEVKYDQMITVPEWIEEAVVASSTLSTYISRPYVQVGWRVSGAEMVLTGVDVAPERIPVLNDDWDVRLGTAFERGQARVLMQPFRAGALENRIPGGVFEETE